LDSNGACTTCGAIITGNVSACYLSGSTPTSCGDYVEECDSSGGIVSCVVGHTLDAAGTACSVACSSATVRCSSNAGTAVDCNTSSGTQACKYITSAAVDCPAGATACSDGSTATSC
jgi:hypothetical protein